MAEFNTIKILRNISRALTTMNPTFTFSGFVILHAFDTIDSFVFRLLKVYVTQAALQAINIVGSAHIIGDPIGAVRSLGTSVRVFVKKTKYEVQGQSPLRAAGFKTLLQVFPFMCTVYLL